MLLTLLVNLVEVDIDELLQLGGVVEIERLVRVLVVEDGEGVSRLHLLRNI